MLQLSTMILLSSLETNMTLQKRYSNQRIRFKTCFSIYASISQAKRRRCRIIFTNSWSLRLTTSINTTWTFNQAKAWTGELKRLWCTLLERWKTKSILKRTWRGKWSKCWWLTSCRSSTQSSRSWGWELAGLMVFMASWSFNMRATFSRLSKASSDACRRSNHSLLDSKPHARLSRYSGTMRPWSSSAQALMWCWNATCSWWTNSIMKSWLVLSRTSCPFSTLRSDHMLLTSASTSSESISDALKQIRRAKTMSGESQSWPHALQSHRLGEFSTRWKKIFLWCCR